MYDFCDYDLNQVFNVMKVINAENFAFTSPEDFRSHLDFQTWNMLRDRCGYWGTGGYYVTTYQRSGHKEGDMPGVHISIQPYSVKKYIEAQQAKMKEIRDIVEKMRE